MKQTNLAKALALVKDAGELGPFHLSGRCGRRSDLILVFPLQEVAWCRLPSKQ